jgi:hypothetical protein
MQPNLGTRFQYQAGQGFNRQFVHLVNDCLFKSAAYFADTIPYRP